MKGIILNGPQGSGKTQLVTEMCNNTNCCLIGEDQNAGLYYSYKLLVIDGVANFERVIKRLPNNYKSRPAFSQTSREYKRPAIIIITNQDIRDIHGCAPEWLVLELTENNRQSVKLEIENYLNNNL